MKPTVYELNIAMDIVVDLLKNGLKEAIEEKNISSWASERSEEFHMGCTKVVFLPETLPEWVIKTDTNGYHLCRREVENYRCAEDNKLERYFAETFCLCKQEGLYFSIQRRGDMEEARTMAEEAFYNSISDSYEPWNLNETSEEREQNISEMCDDMWDSERIYALYDGFEDVDALADFIETRMCNDLHSGNFAVINGEIVIVDFSGYWTDEELEDFE